MNAPLVLGVLGSGKGSNYAAIAQAIEAGALNARVGMVASDAPDAGILHLAERHGALAFQMPPGRFKTRLEPAHEHDLAARLRDAGVELVVLAGFMRLLKEPLITAFPRRIINIHPSLLPKYPGWRRGGKRSKPVSRKRVAPCITSISGWTRGRSSRRRACRFCLMTPPKPCTRASRKPNTRCIRRSSPTSPRAARRSWREHVLNWLAHIVLAGDDEECQLGGVLADLLPMTQIAGLPPGVRRGVALHHAIDAFSDSHPAFVTSTRRITEAGVGLRPAAAAIAVDMLYDHLLARDWTRYGPSRSLEAFCADFYRAALARADHLPVRARPALDLMQTENWLVSYRNLDEIRRVLERIRGRLSPRASAVSPLGRAADVFARCPAAFEENFARFWPEVVAHADAFLK